MADSFVRVPTDSTGKRVDATSLDVGVDTVYRQRIVIGDNSATAQFAIVTNGALTVTGTMNISAIAAVAISGTATVAGVIGLTAGTAVIGDINAISRTVQVAIGTPFTVNNISATVIVATSNPYIVNIPSVSHGPKTVTVSVSSAAVVLMANPGDGVSLYVTQIMCTNGGTVNSRARIGTSATPDTVVGFMASAGGGFTVSFDPPWKLSASATCIASVKPNTVGDCYFLVNFFVAA